MAEGSNGRRRFSDKWGKHELDVLAVLSSAFPQWLTSRQIAQRVKAYADSYGELADQAAKAAFAKQFQRDRAKLAAMGIAIESRQPEYSSKSEGQDFASYRLQLGDEPRVRLLFGTQSIPDELVKVVDQRRFAATVDVDGEHLNVAYADSDDLAMFVLSHPGASIVSPQEAVDAFNRRLHAATQFVPADESTGTDSSTVESPEINRNSTDEDDTEEGKGRPKKNSAFQTGSEVDRRLRLMLFLSAHMGEEYSLEELAERFIGRPKSDDELKKFVNIIHKDINTLTTVSDDGEMAGSQFFDIDWSLLDAEGIVSATNSLGLERLAGISQQYLSMLTASVSYLAHSSLLPDKLLAPDKIFVDEGVYYVAVWTDVSNAAPADKMKFVKTDTTINKATGKPRIWQVLRISRIEHAELVEPTEKVDIPDVPASELRKWSFDNGTPAVFITNQDDLSFIDSLSGATVEKCGEGEKVHLIVSSDSWYVAFCIAHARHITAVAPETLRTMIIARAQHELSVGDRENED